MEKHIDVTDRFKSEINEIAYIFHNLKKGRIYGYNGNCSKSDGSLETNIEKLENALSDLIHKIEYGEESDTERMSRIFNLYNKD